MKYESHTILWILWTLRILWISWNRLTSDTICDVWLMSQRMSDQDSKKGERLELIVTLFSFFLFRTCTLDSHAIVDQQKHPLYATLHFHISHRWYPKIYPSVADHLSPPALVLMTGPGVGARTYPPWSRRTPETKPEPDTYQNCPLAQSL